MKYNTTLDWELAIQWWGLYTREEFSELPVDEQARIIAVYRVVRHMEAVVAKAQLDESK